MVSCLKRMVNGSEEMNVDAREYIRERQVLNRNVEQGEDDLIELLEYRSAGNSDRTSTIERVKSRRDFAAREVPMMHR